MGENWLVYAAIPIGVAAFFLLSALGRRGMGIFLRATVGEEERERILNRLRTQYGLLEGRELTNIRVTGIDFPSSCCMAPLLQVKIDFAPREWDGPSPQEDRQVNVCRKCLKME